VIGWLKKSFHRRERNEGRARRKRKAHGDKFRFEAIRNLTIACSGMGNKTCTPSCRVLHCLSEVSVLVQFRPGAFMHFWESEVHGRQRLGNFGFQYTPLPRIQNGHSC
jgi:hypothetical protein